MLEKNASLPPFRDDCFVCGAAAKGHPYVVRSEVFVRYSGQICFANDQLRTLKAFELLLTTLSPATHRALRRVYNRFGPQLAAAIVHPLAGRRGILCPQTGRVVCPCGFVHRVGQTGGIDRPTLPRMIPVSTSESGQSKWPIGNAAFRNQQRIVEAPPSPAGVCNPSSFRLQSFRLLSPPGRSASATSPSTSPSCRRR